MTSQSIPIACTLTPAAMANRADEIRAVGRAGLRAVEPAAGQVTLRFDPAARQGVERIVAAESQCCAFLDFALEHDDAETTLTIAAPPGAELVMEELADLFAAPTDVTPSRPWSPSP